MKKLGILALILTGALSVQALANEVSNRDIQRALSTEDGVQLRDENQYRFFEIENELNALKEEHAVLKAKKASKFSGWVGSKVEVEDLNGDAHGGKVKFVFAEGSIKHDDYSNWSLFAHVAKEQYFSKHMWNRGGSPQNTIVEVVPRYQFAFAEDNGMGAMELIYTSESIDRRDAIKLKPSVFYKVTEKFAVNYYALVGREFKGGYDDYEFFEMEPGFSYRFADDLGAGFNYFMKWGRVQDDDFSENEKFAKPYIWKNFPEYKLGASLWAEIGPYKNNRGDKNDNIKVGISANKQLTEDLKLVGEVSYKREKKTKNDEKVYIPFVMAGVQYSF